MRLRHCAGLAAALLLWPVMAQAAPVLMISVDGLRPADVLDAKSAASSFPP